MSSPAILFFTYYRLVPTGQIGIFKRCLRMMPFLAEDFDVHLVNYGPLPEKDSLFSSVREKLTIHEPPEEGLGPELVRILESVRPKAVIFGETPLRGSMRLSHRVAAYLGFMQIALENYYGEFLNWYLPKEWPRIDRWMVLGLLEGGEPERTVGNVTVIPPFVRFPSSENGSGRDRACIFGYDKQTLLTATLLLRALPSTAKVDFFIAPQWRGFLERQDVDLSRTGLRILELPTDAAIYDSLSKARFVFGKAGFQQVVEAISLGAPIICRACGGGLEDHLVPPYLKPHVRFLSSDGELQKIMLDIAGWLLNPPISTWSKLSHQVPDPIRFAAEKIRSMIAEGAQPELSAHGR